ncbi:hypothetical protein GZ193_05120 [Dermatophilus congolensis]|uniref:hypothetical protein n=1 Tax=Dermatophilus congolensis TaxID=1863 RepID=UPI000424484E|nr:hypothetical protein [Dermatophilus congolensis]MBO3138378.1 hypothetical protein [Dermatophilus congolensis]MBO3140614.1 hypothetical protein [Dermatophilus congolensis]MBO3190172.1 hypothetical protein [Dermatophilus congolensis]MBO3199157.1 hypothetical protein [Dermatophilus congolensis]
MPPTLNTPTDNQPNQPPTPPKNTPETTTLQTQFVISTPHADVQATPAIEVLS